MADVEFFGERFTPPERFNMRRLTRFATLATKGVDSEDLTGMAAIDGLIDQCLRPEDVDRFDEVCDRERPTFDELMAFVKDVMEAVTDRPTSLPSGSSDGQQSTNGNSVDDSSSQVITDLLERGRPSLALMVEQAQGSKASA